MIKEIKATGKEIEQMLLSGEISRAYFGEGVSQCGYEVNNGKVKFLTSGGDYEDSRLVDNYGDYTHVLYVIYSEKPETIEVREPFKSFLDACEWLSDDNNKYSYSAFHKTHSNRQYGNSLRDLKRDWGKMVKVYKAEVKTKTVRYYVDSQGNEVEVKE